MVVMVIITVALLASVFLSLWRCEVRDGPLHKRSLSEHQLSDHAEVIACSDQQHQQAVATYAREG